MLMMLMMSILKTAKNLIIFKINYFLFALYFKIPI